MNLVYLLSVQLSCWFTEYKAFKGVKNKYKEDIENEIKKKVKELIVD